MPERKCSQRSRNWIPASENSAIVRLAGEGTATEDTDAANGIKREPSSGIAGSSRHSTPDRGIDDDPKAHPASSALRLRRARAAYRRADDAEPPRQAPSGLCQQPERGAGQTSRAV